MPRDNPDWESNYTEPKIMAYPAINSILKERYRLLKMSKKGGMSSVYQAEDIQMTEIKGVPVYVAIKVMSPYLSSDTTALRIFQGEALLNMDTLGSHQNVIDIYSYEQDEGYYFLIMQWLEGRDLEDELEHYKNTGAKGIPLTNLMKYLNDIEAGLSFAHHQGVIHRDIKPSNLFKCDDEKIVLLDFGIHSVENTSDTPPSQSKYISGSYEYLPPEADIADYQASPKDDLYGLAICIYQLLSGHLPFKGQMASHRDQNTEASLVKPCKELSNYQWDILKNTFTKEKKDRKIKTAKEFLNVFTERSKSKQKNKNLPALNNMKIKRSSHKMRIIALSILLTMASYLFYILQHKDKEYIEQEIVIRTANITIPDNNSVEKPVSASPVQKLAPSQPLKSPLNSLEKTIEVDELFTELIIEMKFILVQPGEFVMGSPDGSRQIIQEQNRDEDEKQHNVAITKAFYLGQYEVTQNQWKIVMGSNPSHFARCGMDCPVENVSWDDVQTFILRLNEVIEASGKDYKYRLPTEAEWEYAVRAGTNEASYNGNLTVIGVNNIPELDKIAWYAGNSETNYRDAYDCSEWSGMQYEKISWCGTQTVGGKAKNNWGFHDMLGNVWEWVSDNYSPYPDVGMTTIDPNLQDNSAYRVYRGGSWGYNGSFCRAAKRNRRKPNYKYYNLGFRLARDIQ